MHIDSSDKTHQVHQPLQRRTTPIRICRVVHSERPSNATTEENTDQILQKESCEKAHQPYHISNLTKNLRFWKSSEHLKKNLTPDLLI